MDNRANTIIRVAQREQYTVILSETLRDDRLSWKARGILSYLLSLPDDWVIRVGELERHAPDGRDSLRSGLAELEKHGYLTCNQLRSKRGQIAGTEWIVYESPQPEKPYTEKPYTGNPTTGNPQLLINELTKKGDKLINDELIKDTPIASDGESSHKKIVKALEELTLMDMKIKSNAGRIVRVAKELREAGYDANDIRAFGKRWRTDWRFKADQKPPSLTVIKSEIAHARKPQQEQRAESFRELYKQQKTEELRRK